MRDLAADAYRVATGDTWRPRHGSHTSQTGKLTSAAIDARDFARARKDRETRRALCPREPWSRFTGGKDVTDADAVWTHARPRPGEVRGHDPAARRRPRHREDRRKLGGRARREPGDLPPGLERATARPRPSAATTSS